MVNESSTSSERMIERELMVTGEAVALEVVPATVVSRILSGLIDYTAYSVGGAISLFVVMILAINERSEFGDNLAFIRAIISLVILAWIVVIPLLTELLSRGRSLGRMVTGTRVVRDDGGTVRLRHCLVRTLLAVVEIWLASAVPAVCTSVVSKRGKRLGDMLAGTYVVRDRHRSSMAPPLLMPPELAGWAAGTDLRALPGGLSLTARTFLQRASSMDAGPRSHLGLDLASRVQAYVSPPPPAGTHPERFLAAVLTERRNRELVLATRDRRLEEEVRRDMARPPYEVGREARRR
ncbi:RDD family protein [Actinomyces johnsonii]|uniref:RDD family protein n=1 Tax=Actinomyces johnsonii TaxID=544581 RepID=UPI0028D40AE4|nr:RDD family protein [Actinomyces johnsonii]